MNFRKRHLISSIAAALFIFVQSALPAGLSARESGILVSLLAVFLHIHPAFLSMAVRKCAHFLEFMILGICLSLLFFDRTYSDYRTQRPVKLIVLTLVTGILYAVTDELHQYFSPGRSCELRDMLIDSAGIVFGLLAVLFLPHLRKPRDHSGIDL